MRPFVAKREPFNSERGKFDVLIGFGLLGKGPVLAGVWIMRRWRLHHRTPPIRSWQRKDAMGREYWRPAELRFEIEVLRWRFSVVAQPNQPQLRCELRHLDGPMSEGDAEALDPPGGVPAARS